jgi:phosphonate transport system substrate-binding protein
VQSGAYDAGVVNEQVWRTSLHDGRANRAKVVAIWRTPGYPDYHWISQGDLDQRFGKGFTRKLQGQSSAGAPPIPSRNKF